MVVAGDVPVVEPPLGSPVNAGCVPTIVYVVTLVVGGGVTTVVGGVEVTVVGVWGVVVTCVAVDVEGVVAVDCVVPLDGDVMIVVVGLGVVIVGDVVVCPDVFPSSNFDDSKNICA